jgi:antitoxin (DNA-binding transcriptional repressor) of toxin-antitoxin stability system
MAGIIDDMDEQVIHISEAEDADNFSSLLARVKAGAEVVIERDDEPVAVLRPAAPVRRLISESIALAEAHASTAKLDGNFGRDLEDAINRHRFR